MGTASDLNVVGFDLQLAIRGGVGGAYAQPKTASTNNTKTLASTDCMQVDLQKGEGEGLGRDRCAFLVKASAFASGFTPDASITPKAGDLFTPTGETVAWLIFTAALRGAGAFYRLDAYRDRVGWDS